MSGEATSGLPLDRELFARVRRIEIKTRRAVTASLAGTYHSAFRGRGVEFSEVREYQPGDDVRAIDWNVTSRSTRPDRKLFVKLFHEERELTVVILADLSPSQGFGSGEKLKRDLVVELTALLAFAAIRNRDRVGLVGFSAGIDCYLPPRRGRGHALRLIRETVAQTDERPRATNLADALRFTQRVQRRPAVIFLLSDLFAPSYERELHALTQRHDVVVLSLVDRAERDLPAAGLVLLEDPETGARRLVDTGSPRVRAALAMAAERRRSERDALLMRCGVDHVELDAADQHYDALERFFHRRAAQRASRAVDRRSRGSAATAR